MNEIIILQEPVELYKILKFESLVGSGGEARFVIGEGMVLVNGETELRKRRKIIAGDVIGFNEDEFLIVKSEKQTE